MAASIVITPGMLDGLEPGPARYLIELAGAADRDGIAFIARGKIAARLGVTERTISRWNAALIDAGKIYRVAGGHRGMITRWAISAYLSVREETRARVLAARYSARRAGRLLKGLSSPIHSPRPVSRPWQRPAPAGPRSVRAAMGPEHPSREDQLRALEALYPEILRQ